MPLHRNPVFLPAQQAAHLEFDFFDGDDGVRRRDARDIRPVPGAFGPWRIQLPLAARASGRLRRLRLGISRNPCRHWDGSGPPRRRRCLQPHRSRRRLEAPGWRVGAGGSARPRAFSETRQRASRDLNGRWEEIRGGRTVLRRRHDKNSSCRRGRGEGRHSQSAHPISPPPSPREPTTACALHMPPNALTGSALSGCYARRSRRQCLCAGSSIPEKTKGRAHAPGPSAVVRLEGPTTA